MFLDLEKEKSESYSMEPFGIAKESLLSTSTCLECHPKNNLYACVHIHMFGACMG
jgi:hypothetical protein